MREKDMINPNELGYIHRDIVEAEPHDRWYMMLKLSCGHRKLMLRKGYLKYKNDATLCIECTEKEEAKK